jgi:ubiquinone/menaquinone biosynthesis C-methylase UbiE
VMDALKMDWPDNSFDLVWACESGEHMPDKKRYVEEMTRVLKPGALCVLISRYTCPHLVYTAVLVPPTSRSPALVGQ